MLFAPNRLHRVNTCRSTRRHPDGECGDGDEDERNSDEGQRIDGVAPVEHSANELTRAEGEHEANAATDRYESESLAHHEAHDVATCGADGHADTNLARALRDSVRHHAVYPDRREDKSEQSENAEGSARQPRRHQRDAEMVVERADVRERQIRIERGDFGAQDGDE